MIYFFFFKQKTAYEIKECDWSSDVCSSDLDDRAEKLAELRELKATTRSAKDPGEFMVRRLFQAIESEDGE